MAACSRADEWPISRRAAQQAQTDDLQEHAIPDYRGPRRSPSQSAPRAARARASGTVISSRPPHPGRKITHIVNRCGETIDAATGVHFLAEDFKRRAGFQRSVELARKYGLYRQDYWGCLFSRR